MHDMCKLRIRSPLRSLRLLRVSKSRGTRNIVKMSLSSLGASGVVRVRSAETYLLRNNRFGQVVVWPFGVPVWIYKSWMWFTDQSSIICPIFIYTIKSTHVGHESSVAASINNR